MVNASSLHRSSCQTKILYIYIYLFYRLTLFFNLYAFIYVYMFIGIYVYMYILSPSHPPSLPINTKVKGIERLSRS